MPWQNDNNLTRTMKTEIPENLVLRPYFVQPFICSICFYVYMFSPLCHPSSAFTQPPFTDSILWYNMGDFHLSAWRHFSNVAEWAGDLGKGWAELMHINPPANDKFPLRWIFFSFSLLKIQSVILALGQKKGMLENHKSQYVLHW